MTKAPMTAAQTRRAVACLAVGFLVTMAVLLRYHVYGGGPPLPLEQRRTYHLSATAATYLDTTTFQVRTGVPVTNTVSLYGDAPAGGERTAVWVEFSSLETRHGLRLDYHERRTAFDRHTGLAVDCCDPYIDDDTSVRQTGLAFVLPRGAGRRGYPMFDPVLRRQATLRYEGAEAVQGLPAYRYGYTAGPAKVEDLPGRVPGRVLGLRPGTLVGVARFARITRTLWVEPESGLPVRVRERRLDTLRTADQVDRVVAFQADLDTDADDVRELVAEAAGFRRWAFVIRDIGPVVFLALAVVPLTVAVRGRREGRADGSAAAQDEQQVPGDDLADAG